VFDPGYGKQLSILAAQMAVWIIGSPTNVAIAKDVWKQHPESQHMVTTFQPATFADLMDNIELHHGHHSQTPPFQELEVIGMTFSAEAQQVLRDYGFGSATATDVGFVAGRAPGARTSHEESS